MYTLTLYIHIGSYSVYCNVDHGVGVHQYPVLYHKLSAGSVNCAHISDHIILKLKYF